MKVEHSTHNFPFIFVSKYLLDWHDWYVRASASVHGGKPSKENTDPFFHIYYMFHVIRRNKGKDKYKKGGEETPVVATRNWQLVLAVYVGGE